MFCYILLQKNKNGSSKQKLMINKLKNNKL